MLRKKNHYINFILIYIFQKLNLKINYNLQKLFDRLLLIKLVYK